MDTCATVDCIQMSTTHHGCASAPMHGSYEYGGHRTDGASVASGASSPVESVRIERSSFEDALSYDLATLMSGATASGPPTRHMAARRVSPDVSAIDDIAERCASLSASDDSSYLSGCPPKTHRLVDSITSVADMEFEEAINIFALKQRCPKPPARPRTPEGDWGHYCDFDDKMVDHHMDDPHLWRDSCATRLPFF